MCGIAGRINYAKDVPIDRESVRRMTATIAHRGPDDDGFLMAGPVGLGFRRLSIIDLAGGHQPMSDADETVWVVFNGEIYNFKELRTELEGHGYSFRTRSDTEVIVHGYRAWGMGVFERLNGMFGVAIWDSQRRRLVVARDAMGIKPIYYRDADGQLTFASEVRAVIAGDSSAPDVDPLALNLFLKYRYTPSPLTVFKGVRKLAPGTLLRVENGTCTEERWYSYTPVPFERQPSDEDAARELLSLYRAAVGRHLLSDVPVGIFLSGGLDSALLLALMNEHGGPWRAYTIGYGETFEDDELKDAAETASLLGAEHIQVQLDREEFERSLPRIVASLEEPVASSSIVPMYFVSQRARQDVKVALIGQGPDELFCGYKRHIGVRYGQSWRGLPAPVRELIRSAVDRLPRNETLKRGVYSLGHDDRLRRYQHVFALAPRDTIDGLFREGLLPSGDGDTFASWAALLPQMAYIDDLSGFQLLEIRSSLPDELLMFGDKLSMAHGLEARVPYLDRTVVEYAQRLGTTLKIRRLRGKWLHREVCRQYLPAPILRRKKKGFAVTVVDEWFQHSLQGALPEMLLDPASLIYDILEPRAVQSLLALHRRG